MVKQACTGMRSYDCPSCGAAVLFQSSIAMFATCSFCRTMVVRKDVSVENVGRTAELPPDLSPLRIGTHGTFGDLGFALIGRLRQKWEEGSWTEWCALFSENQWGWVAEAQGIYMVSLEYQPPIATPALETLSPGVWIELEKTRYRVADIKETTCLGSEGELPFVAVPGRKGTSVDLMGKGGAYACLEYSDSGVRYYVGRYAHFDDLKFTELRPVPGWSPDAPEEKKRNLTQSLSCPVCGAPLDLRARGISVSAVCGSCDSILDTSDEQVRLIEKYIQSQKFHPLIPLGTRGELFGTQYEVIGFMRRTPGPYPSWFEYLLFNPWKGFRWLINFQGHWTLADMIFEEPKLDADSKEPPSRNAYYKGNLFHLFAHDPATVTYVMGEFYWRVKKGETVQATDYICPPRILSREEYTEINEVTWSEGIYLDSELVKSAFKLPESLPERIGIYLNQPNPYKERWPSVRWTAAAFLLLLIIIQFFTLKRSDDEELLKQGYLYNSGQTNRLIVTKPFEVKDGSQLLGIASSAPVDNSWIEIGFDRDLLRWFCRH